MLIVDERISIPRCTLTAPKSCEKAIGNVDTRPLPPVFPHCTEQWVKQLAQAEQEYPLPLSFTTAFCGVANDIGAGTRILGVEVKASTFIIYIKDNPSGTVQLIAIGR